MPKAIYRTATFRVSSLSLATVYCENAKDAMAHARYLAQYYNVAVVWHWESREKEIHTFTPPSKPDNKSGGKQNAESL